MNDVLANAVARLKQAGIAGAEGDARRLLSRFPEPQAFRAAIIARAARQPVAQITGLRAFWKHEFEVTQDTLDPRPETETLVEAALTLPPPSRVLDLGTGTGCLLLSVLAESPGATGLGVDVSPGALTVARRNADRLGLAGRADFQRGDWLTGLDEGFDLILCNPPYIPAGDIAALAPDVRDWEPHMALTPGATGLEAYRTIARDLPRVLSATGAALFEFGRGQGAAVAEIFAPIGDVRLLNDLGGVTRAALISGVTPQW